MARIKEKILFGSSVLTSTNTISQAADSNWQYSVMGFNKMDVVIDVVTFTGTSPTMTVSVQEQIDVVSGSPVWLETAKSASITGATVVGLAQQAATNAQSTATQGAFPMLGKGGNKQVVLTLGGTVGSASVNIYFIFFED